MRKLIIICVAVLLLTGCAARREELAKRNAEIAEAEAIVKRDAAIAEVNEGSMFPFPLGLPETELEYGEEYERGEGFGCFSIRKDGTWISIAGWPDCLDDYHVIEYRLTDSTYSVFGISVAEPPNEGETHITTGSHEFTEQQLAKRGYEKSTETDIWNDGSGRYVYIKDDAVKISLHVDADGVIYEIWATLVVTNKENVVF